jgi:hypothetical protein
MIKKFNKHKKIIYKNPFELLKIYKIKIFVNLKMMIKSN